MSQSHGDKQIGFAPSTEGDTTLRHPDINLQPQYDVLQEDLRSEVRWNNPKVLATVHSKGGGGAAGAAVAPSTPTFRTLQL